MNLKILVPLLVGLLTILSDIPYSLADQSNLRQEEADRNYRIRECVERFDSNLKLPSGVATVMSEIRSRGDVTCYRLMFRTDRINSKTMAALVDFSPYRDFWEFHFYPSCQLYEDSTSDELGLCDQKLDAQRSRLRELLAIAWPEGLSEVRDYYKQQYEFGIWALDSQMKFVRTKNDDSLHEKFGNIDPSSSCAKEIQDANDHLIKHKARIWGKPTFEWNRCVTGQYKKQLAKYPAESWKKFAARYSIEIKTMKYTPEDTSD